MSLRRPAQVGDAGRRRHSIGRVEGLLDLRDVVRQVTLAALQLLLELGQLGTPLLDPLLAQEDVAFELGLALDQVLLTFLELLVRDLDVLPPLGEPDSLGRGEVAGRAQLGLALAQAPRPVVELRLLGAETFLPLRDRGGPPRDVAVVAARRQRLPQPRGDGVDVVGGDLDPEDEGVCAVLGHGTVRRSMGRTYRSRHPSYGCGMRVLIAEDETIIRLDLRDLLQRSGLEVCAEARDGEEAVELARSEQPDLAIMDVKMPKLDGIEAARRILGERPIPIVMLTAYGQQELVSRAVEAGVFGYLVKPFREQDLLPAIRTARARHEELLALREEAESLADALAARKAIERAKGLLMEREGLSEQDAFARLRKASQISGRPLKVVAEALIATFEA